MAGRERIRKVVGRASAGGPANRFESTRLESDFEQIADDELQVPRKVPTVFLSDQSQTILCSNDSPDISFRYSVNPYRGCEHGCAYCYARPGHEFLGMNAGIDFESKILVKFDAPNLLRRELCRSSWRGDVIAISGVTDCYQPAERNYQLTRGLLEVSLEAQQPVSIVTKNSLVLRDLDLIQPMAANRLAQVNLSITTLDPELARTMEPRTATPVARLGAVRDLSEAGVPVRIMVAPVIPGLTDSEIPAILRAAQEAGAVGAGFQLLRLPLTVAPVFTEWLAEQHPQVRQRVESRIRGTRDGSLSDSVFGRRHVGQGRYAELIANTFRLFARKYKLNSPLPPLDSTRFRPPRAADGQLRLF